MAKLNTKNLQVATLHKPELQKPLSPISVPDYGETAARQVRAFDYIPKNPEANKLVAPNAILALIDDGRNALEKLPKAEARVMANFNKAHRAQTCPQARHRSRGRGRRGKSPE